MNINDITKGNWYKEGDLLCCDNVWIAQMRNALKDDKEVQKEIDANSELLCEAGNVANGTGLSPRELLKQRDILLNALKIILVMPEWQKLYGGEKIDTIAVNAVNSSVNNVK